MIGSASNWCSLSTERQSRYEGWFVEDDRYVPSSFTKIIERVSYLKGGDNDILIEPQGMTLTGEHAFWEYGDGAKLGFYALPDAPALRMQTARSATLELSLDIRGIYQSPDLGRSFVQYEDHLLNRPMYLAIKTDGECCLDEYWEEVPYPWDVARNSGDATKHIYNLTICNATFVACGASSTAEVAQAACTQATTATIPVIGIGITHTHDSASEEVRSALFSAHQTLEMLMHSTGIYAGLPWFHQVWARDELIAALGMPAVEQLNIIKKYIDTKLQEGELPTFVGSGTYSADGIGWLSLLIREYDINQFDAATKKNVTAFLKEATNELRKHRYSHEMLIHSSTNATWMDTIGREGCRIEIQTMYALALELLADLTEDKSFNQERVAFLERVKEHFYKKGVLWDGHNDRSIRPNCFLAYLLQPDMLKAQEWERVFGAALASLRTPWGGLASLDNKDPRFQPLSTGENNFSYHNGDSWFFVNNLAGVALSRFGMKIFKPVIEELLRSSTSEILWKHVAGQVGEIASARNGESWGCGTQAFSAGAFLMFADELGYK
jgi:glycogen debranching enzyme